MTLYQATKPQHHACEQHPFGTRMSRGDVTAKEYADWLASMALLHSYVDGVCPDHMNRAAGFAADRIELLSRHGVTGMPAQAIAYFVGDISKSEASLLGAAYVLHGAHRTGGQIMRPLLTSRRLPTWHLYYPDHRAAKRFVDDLRGQTGLCQPARATFAALLGAMDQIVEGASC